jgi:hypothetical protein
MMKCLFLVLLLAVACCEAQTYVGTNGLSWTTGATAGGNNAVKAWLTYETTTNGERSVSSADLSCCQLVDLNGDSLPDRFCSCFHERLNANGGPKSKLNLNEVKMNNGLTPPPPSHPPEIEVPITFSHFSPFSGVGS